jgi:hypothetical protein
MIVGRLSQALFMTMVVRVQGKIKGMAVTNLILDGLYDPRVARRLSAQWAKAGLYNAIDPAGQSARLSKPGAPERILQEGDPLDAASLAVAIGIAREFGFEPRVRVGNADTGSNDLESLRHHVSYEYKCRFATALMFGLPALVLHYIGPVLAGGGASSKAMIYPWLIEGLLVGWVCLAAGWPILWQGAMSFVHLRVTTDLLTSTLIVGSFVPSVYGVLSLCVVDRPWFVGGWGGGQPMFHATVSTVILAVAQRWLVHRAAVRLAGRSGLMPFGYGLMLGLWGFFMMVTAAWTGWEKGLAVGMLLPPAASLGAVNRWSPGWSSILPVLGFASVFLWGARSFGLSITGVRIEIAAMFSLMMTMVYVMGWNRLPAINHRERLGKSDNRRADFTADRDGEAETSPREVDRA